MGNTNTLLGFGIYLLCRSTQLHHQNKLASSSNIQNTVFAKMNRHVQSCHETVMIDPVTFETSDGVLPLHPLLCEVIIKFYTLAKASKFAALRTMHFPSTAAAPRTGLLPNQPPKMYIPSAASLHTAVCSFRCVGAVPLKVTSDHVAVCRQLWLETGFWIQVWDVHVDSKCQKPHKKVRTKTEF